MTKRDIKQIQVARSQGTTWKDIGHIFGIDGRIASGPAMRAAYRRATKDLGYTKRKPRVDVAQPGGVVPFVIGSPAERPKALIIPDTQIGQGQQLDHLTWAGQYAREKAVDIVVMLGDWADMKSLSSYDKGKRDAENQRYSLDLAVANEGLALFESALKPHKPTLKLVTLGNHENRINRYTADHPELHGHVSTDDLHFAKHEWIVSPYLAPVEINGVLVCHQFCRSANGKVTQTKFGAPSALAQVRREMQSCIAGHTPGLDTAVVVAGKRMLRGIIAGSYYQHDEHWMTAQGHVYWRGLLLLHELWEGNFALCEVPLEWLRRRYATTKRSD